MSSAAVPLVSVVIGAFNAEASLERTLDSVLAQEGVALEVIVVDDGSTDATAAMLAERGRRDGRVLVVHQPHAGLTRALIRGCEAARGQFIARQDMGDESLPGRMAAQASRLLDDPALAAMSCHTRTVAPSGELLAESRITQDELAAALLGKSAAVSGPSHHGSVMMRTSAYRDAGGYRDAFYFAQDLDLWTRLVALGGFGVVPEMLYEAGWQPRSISALRRREQTQLAELIARAAQARRDGQDEAPWVDAARRIRPGEGAVPRRRLAQGNYFLGSALRDRRPEAAQHYLREALRDDPLHWRAWLRLAQLKLGLRL